MLLPATNVLNNLEHCMVAGRSTKTQKEGKNYAKKLKVDTKIFIVH